jgi:hypothetical protein
MMNDEVRAFRRPVSVIARMMNPAFRGRTDWLKRWNPKTRRFESVDIHQIMMLMALRKTLNHEKRS